MLEDIIAIISRDLIQDGKNHWSRIEIFGRDERKTDCRMKSRAKEYQCSLRKDCQLGRSELAEFPIRHSHF